jgi:hypothetical protein
MNKRVIRDHEARINEALATRSRARVRSRFRLHPQAQRPTQTVKIAHVKRRSCHEGVALLWESSGRG